MMGRVVVEAAIENLEDLWASVAERFRTIRCGAWL